MNESVKRLYDTLQGLKSPNNIYKCIPFWSWNDDLDKEELSWQTEQMKETGLGGYFMHARAGLKTPYMEEKWMECIEVCLEKAGILDMGGWLYDENGYPSGFAGGQIPALGEQYCQKFLKMEVVKGTEFEEKPGTLGIYRTQGSYKRIEASDINENEELLHAWYEINPYYSDLLDEKVVKAFIESTYEVYYKRFKEYFGREMPGFFTDEPQYGRTGMPWSFIIPEKFTGMYGYDLLEHLPALYYKTPGFRKIRYDFWNLIEKLFTEGVSKQLADWCDKHNCKLTGHVLLEEDMRFQTMCSGSAMGFYKYMHIPGIDWLGRSIGNPVIVKQVSSVAEQLGKKLVLSEMFGAAGWGISIEELKHVAEWQYALGINLTCAHLEAYSLKGERKKDHPPALSYQLGWRKEYGDFCNYLARLGMILSEGEYKPEILIIHPLRSAWTAFDASCYANGTNSELKALDDSFADLSKILSGLHLDYHYGDEEIISEYGKVKDGEFIIGENSYRIVIIPPSITLEPSTVRLLRGFIQGGGKVFAFEEFPGLINGVESETLGIMKQQCTMLVPDSENIKEALDAKGLRRISITGEDNSENMHILHRISSYNEGTIIYLVNTDARQGYETVITTDITGACYALDLKDLSVSSIEYSCIEGTLNLDLNFAPSQSYVLLVTDAAIPFTKNKPGVFNRYYGTEAIKLENSWKIKPLDLNVLVLDYCRLAKSGGAWSEPKPVTAVQSELLELGRSLDVALEFAIDSRYSFNNGEKIYLVIEDLDKYAVEINGKAISNNISGWWKDKGMQRLDISGLLQDGRNTLILKTQFLCSPELLGKLDRAKVFEAEANMLTLESELENIYLLGEFAVKSDTEYISADNSTLIQKGSFYLDLAEKISEGQDAVDCGCPFYTGKMAFYQDVLIEDPTSYKSLILSFDKPHAVCSELYVNDRRVETFLWAPYETDILPFVNKGVNTISFHLTNSDRNLFGPHHHPRGEVYTVGPKSFTQAAGWEDSYCLVRFGMGNEVRLYANKK